MNKEKDFLEILEASKPIIEEVRHNIQYLYNLFSQIGEIFIIVKKNDCFSEDDMINLCDELHSGKLCLQYNTGIISSDVIDLECVIDRLLAITSDEKYKITFSKGDDEYEN